MPNKGYYPFKFIQGQQGRHQSKASIDFLLVINTNWHPISYRRLLFKFWTICVFQPPFGA